MADDGKPLIVVDHARKTYRMGGAPLHALDDASLVVRRGEFAAILGASGSGKSTLMNLVGLMDTPTSGRILLDGADISRLTPNKRAGVRAARIGFVFQSFNLLPRLSVLDNVMVPLLYARRSFIGGAVERVVGESLPRALPRPVRKRVVAPLERLLRRLGCPRALRAFLRRVRDHAPESELRAREALARVGMSDRLEHLPAQLSGGERQRVAIARATVNNPDIILADEPTGALDSENTAKVMELFRELNAGGVTVLVVTHDPMVATYTDRIIRLHDGRVAEDRAR